MFYLVLFSVAFILALLYMHNTDLGYIFIAYYFFLNIDK